MEPHSIPNVSVSLSIDPATHSSTDSQAPNLDLTMTSHHPDPITIYADDLSPSLMLSCGAFTMTDLTTGSEKQQRISSSCPHTTVVEKWKLLPYAFHQPTYRLLAVVEVKKDAKPWNRRTKI